MFNFFLPENRAVYEIMWKNIVERGRPQMTIWRLRIACWITKATDTHSEYVIPVAFPRRHWLRERFFLFRYTYTALVSILINSPIPELTNSRRQ